MRLNRKSDRVFSLEINKKNCETPFFFPAISSIRTNMDIGEYIQIIEKIRYPSFLISSYDLFNSDEKNRFKLINKINNITNGEILTLLDSGHYESHWYHDKKWTFNKFENILKDINIDFSFSYDVHWEKGMILNSYIKKSITNVAKTAASQKMGITIPLIHSELSSILKIVKKVIIGINPQVIGIPERELGTNLFERIKMVKKIRAEIDKTNRNVILHLLGTGNPISILLYSYAGADFFDGLEWCKNVVNPNTGHLFHFVQKDLFNCNCSACELKKISYPTKTIAHNLIFYRKLMEDLKKSLHLNNLNTLKKYLSKEIIKKVMEILK